MSKIKILHIIKSLGRGGAEMLLPETLKEHNQDLFEFHYIYFLPWKNQMVEAIESAGGRVSCFKAKNNLQLLSQYSKIIQYCKENQIQLIHAHLPWAGFVSRLVHYKTGIPVFYTEHNLQNRYHFMTKLINKWSFNCQTMAIGVSEDVTQSILQNIYPSISCKTLLNGVNVQNFQRNNPEQRSIVREQYGVPEDAILVGTVAVFRFQKRLDKWLEILSDVIAKNSNIYGIIVGAGILEPEIYAKHKELNLEGKVFFTGLQTNVKPYYEAMDVFMMSSSFEGLPIALLEAMSMGCAIVSTDAGGIKEVLKNNENGIIVPVDDWRTLSTSILDLAQNPSQLAYFQNEARKRVIASFSIGTMVFQLESLYSNCQK
jgi:glycosyltransferase involved in cell wall biosynthesis